MKRVSRPDHKSRRTECGGLSGFPCRLYKNTRRERLIVYGLARTRAEPSTKFQSNKANASHENTVAAMNPGASTLQRRHPVRRPHDAAFCNILAQKVHMALQFS